MLVQAQMLVMKYGIKPGMHVEDKDGPADFGYVSQTGHLVFYYPGERNMQDSWAMTPEAAEKAYFKDSPQLDWIPTHP